MTVTFVAIMVSAVFVSGVVSGVIGLVTVAIHREERRHALLRPAPDRATCAARGLNGFHVRAPAAAEASRHGRKRPPNNTPSGSAASAEPRSKPRTHLDTRQRIPGRT